MGVVSLYGFQTLPGKLEAHLAAAEEARQLLVELGQQAITVQTIAGSEVGTIGTLINHSDNLEWAKAYQSVMSNPKWLEFYMRISSQAIAELVETSVFQDVDPTFTPDPDRPLGVIVSAQWRPLPGKLSAFMDNVMTASGHFTRLGGAVRVVQCMMGKYPMSITVAVTYEDLEHMGEFQDKLAVDEQWNAFWGGVMANPTADVLRTQIAVTNRG